MRITDDLTCCESVPEWARAHAAASGARVASFGHTVIGRVDWHSAGSFVPLHDVLEFSFAESGSAVAPNEAEAHFAAIFQIGSPVAQQKRLPSLRLTIEREHFDAVVREHFTGDALPSVRGHTFLRGTPHGRGLYTLAAALLQMVEERADLLSRYCQEIALIKAIALAPPSMMELKCRGETWGPAMRRVELAAQFMVRQIEEPFALARVAAAAGCSERTLNEAFQRYLSLTPLQFHRHCRLEAAYADLTRSCASVTEVALKYGFENMGRFARAFRDRFGINPSDVPQP